MTYTVTCVCNVMITGATEKSVLAAHKRHQKTSPIHADWYKNFGQWYEK